MRTQNVVRKLSLVLFCTFIVFQFLFTQELDLSPGKKVVLRTEAFQSDSDTLDKAMLKSLGAIGAYLQQRPDLKIEVTGHCDSTGKVEYNEDLALRRARRVKDYLVMNYSVPVTNVVAIGTGSRFPIATNTTTEGRAKNRRVEITPVTSLTQRKLTDDNNKPANEEGVLSFFNGAVQTKAPWDIGFGDAFLAEPIYELHKINTRTQARAEVTFNDNSRLQVGENSLVIVYGLESKEPAIKEKGNIELIKGDLLAKLRAIERKQQYVVKTPSASMSFNTDSKSKFSVDKIDRSTVSVFEGKTEVSAAGKSIEVPENYGTQIYRDTPPEPPRLLSDPPVVFTPEKNFLPWSKDGVTFTWKPNSYASKLEISTDTNFNSLVWSVTTTKTLSKVNLDGGTYYYHFQGIDSVGLEGKPSPMKTLVVKKYSYDRAKLDILTVDEGINSVDEPEVILAGNADPGSLVKINGERILLQPKGGFTRTLSLIEGNNTFIIEARDSAGFENSKTIVYQYIPSRRFGVTIGFAPLVFPDRYGTLKIGGNVSLQLPQLFSSTTNFGINLTAGEFTLSNPKGESDHIFGSMVLRPYGLAELLLTIEGSSERPVVSFMEVTSGVFLWPKYRGDYYSTPSGGAYAAGLGLGLRSNGPSDGFGIRGIYRWISNDYKRFDPYASDGIHGMFDVQLAYYLF